MWGRSPPNASGSYRLTLACVDALDLQAFQAARFGMKNSDLSLSSRHALKLMPLIDRVLKHHAAETGWIGESGGCTVGVGPPGDLAFGRGELKSVAGVFVGGEGLAADHVLVVGPAAAGCDG